MGWSDSVLENVPCGHCLTPGAKQIPLVTGVTWLCKNSVCSYYEPEPAPSSKNLDITIEEMFSSHDELEFLSELDPDDTPTDHGF